MADRIPNDESLVLYKTVDAKIDGAGKVAVISLNRPSKANTQNMAMLYLLDDCLQEALHDPEVRCIVLRGEGKHFSAGHDLADKSGRLGDTWKPRGAWKNYKTSSFGRGPPSPLPTKVTGKNYEMLVEGWFNREREIFKDMADRWRNAPKPTICSVQGQCIAGGLMLCWPCDIIVASEDAVFKDIAVTMGVCGVEYFSHPYEMGSRRAKEMLYTGQAISAKEARDVMGFVSHVVPRDRLDEFSLELAHKIAASPLFALQMTKEAVNQVEDAGGRQAGMAAAFSLHQLCHAHNLQRYGMPIDPVGSFKPQPMAKTASKL